MKSGIIVGLLGIIAGCSDGSGSTPDLGSTDTGPCGASIYPCGPYGTTVSSVAQNLSFQGFADPKTQCKAHKDQTMDTTTVRTLSFADWYRGETGCEKKELLWVAVSAGWCEPCKDEVKAIQQKYAAGAWDKRLGVLNVVFETDPPSIKPADAEFTKRWISAFGLTFPVAMDPSFQMGAYFSKKNTPFNMFIDLKTMRIYFRNTGSGGNFDKIISDFFAGN